MALRALSWLLLLCLLAVRTLVPCTCYEERAPVVSSSLIQCYDTLTNATNDDTEFRASLLPLLAALPSGAAPTGFASLRSNRSAFVRGLCFGDAPVPSECLGCLTAAARNLASGCVNTTRRAGMWTENCFLAYADTHASSPAEDVFRSRVLLRFQGDDAARATVPVPDPDGTYNSSNLHAWLVDMAQGVARSVAANISDTRMLATADISVGCVLTSTVNVLSITVHVLAQCARDRTAADCVRCLQDSAGAVDWDLDADRRDGGVAAAVLGFNCYLRLNVSTALVPQNTGSYWVLITVLIVLVVGIVAIFGGVFCMGYCDSSRVISPLPNNT